MIDAGRITTLKIDARRGHNNVHDCKELLALLTLAENYLHLRDDPELIVKGEGILDGEPYIELRSGDELDAAVDAAREGGEP